MIPDTSTVTAIADAVYLGQLSRAEAIAILRRAGFTEPATILDDALPPYFWRRAPK